MNKLIFVLLQMFCEFNTDISYSYLSPELLLPGRSSLNHGLKIESLHLQKKYAKIAWLTVRQQYSNMFLLNI